MSLLLTLLLACEGPAPAPPAEGPAQPTVEQLAGWLSGDGTAPERHGDILRVAVDDEGGPLGITAQVLAEDEVVLLATSGLLNLSDTDGDGGVVALLTTMATLNYETLEGKLQLNPATGEVILSLELPTDDGLGRATFEDGVRTLADTAARLRPTLRRAASGR